MWRLTTIPSLSVVLADMAPKFEVEDLRRLPSELFDQASSFQRQDEDDEEEDYMAGLTRQMAQFFLQDDAAAENFSSEAAEAKMGVRATESMPWCQGRKTGARGCFANPFVVGQHLHRLQAARVSVLVAPIQAEVAFIAHFLHGIC